MTKIILSGLMAGALTLALIPGNTEDAKSENTGGIVAHDSYLEKSILSPRKAVDARASRSLERSVLKAEVKKPAAKKKVKPAPKKVKVKKKVKKDKPAKVSSAGRPTGLWLALAKCESGANPKRNSGNGYYGAYQFSQSTWEGFKGTRFAPTPLQATWAEQTFVAYRIWLHPKQGWKNGFPGCGKKMGYPVMPKVPSL
jgi:hypothetical protein